MLKLPLGNVQHYNATRWDVSESEREATVRRVRGMLKLAGGQKAGGAKLSKKNKQMREIENWKQLFMKVSTSGEGTLSFEETRRLARKYLKITERVCPDQDLYDFFQAIDSDGGGALDFGEFMDFVNRKPSEAAHNAKIVELVKRSVRLAMARQKMTLEQLEFRFYHSAEEGILDDPNGNGSLGPEEMRRFFRKVLSISDHEVSDRHLVIAFRSMDEDNGGSLDAEEFMDFIRLAVKQENCLSPRNRTGQTVPNLIGGMSDVKLENPPLTGFPFNCNGRDLAPSNRFQMFVTPISNCYASSSPPLRPGSTRRARTSHGTRNLEHSSSMPARPSTSQSTGQLPMVQQKNGNHYRFMGADALNRIEERLFQSGVDVRGGYHRQS